MMSEQTIKEPKTEQLIKSIKKCHEACLDSLSYCIDMGGPHAEPNHLTVLIDCAKICETSNDFLLRDSGFSPLPVEICSLICDECADSCEQFKDDENMQRCATMCRECKKECSDYTDQFEEIC